MTCAPTEKRKQLYIVVVVVMIVKMIQLTCMRPIERTYLRSVAEAPDKFRRLSVVIHDRISHWSIVRSAKLHDVE